MSSATSENKGFKFTCMVDETIWKDLAAPIFENFFSRRNLSKTLLLVLEVLSLYKYLLKQFKEFQLGAEICSYGYWWA